MSLFQELSTQDWAFAAYLSVIGFLLAFMLGVPVWLGGRDWGRAKNDPFESGIVSVDDARLLPARVDAVLVGTVLMTSDDPMPLVRGLAGIARPVSV